MPTRPVPPPVGYKRTSGIVQPSCSASSSPIVFLPSRRYGSLSVERSNQPICGATFATTLPAVAIEPSMVKTLAPAIAASAIAAGGVPRGTITAHGSPQRAAYTAAAPPALPAEGITKRSEEHTSELQSLAYLVCRLLLEKKKKEYEKLVHDSYRL